MVIFNRENQSEAKIPGGLFKKTTTVPKESQFFSKAQKSGTPIDGYHDRRTATECFLRGWQLRFGTGIQLNSEVFFVGILIY
ncbi:hypothetical protein [Synechococcus sp. MIT S9504]|uniref:hypothetical protein n=1 Tax=Synechococcus sp. MIT S9504 TaxID=1801628 RepID=UPI0012E812FC|nr:hypothetical protein [Synechococcus sp. MIT S9504]